MDHHRQDLSVRGLPGVGTQSWVRRLLLMTALLVPLITFAQLSPSVQKALDWLSAQIQGASLTGEGNAAGTVLQTRAEVAQTMRTLATLPAPLGEGIVNGPIDPDAADTETLARRILVGSMGGLDYSALLQELLKHRAADGGFGGAQGTPSSVLDSAWAVLALTSAGRGADVPAASARRYLVGQVSADGGMALGNGHSIGSRVYASALASLALQSGTDVSSAQAVTRITAYLLAQQGTDGGWQSDTLITAWALQAIAPVSSDSGVRSAAAAFLEGKQSADGSWGGDPYITAVAMRALSARANPAPAPGRVLGEVVDAGSGLSLDGVTVSTDGGVSALSDATGSFILSGLTQGSYSVTFSRAGYQSRVMSVTLSAGQSLDVGRVQLTANASTSIVKGVVTSQSTGQALAGVTVTLGGSTTQTRVTDSSGRFEFSAVNPGNVTVSAAAPGYVASSGAGAIVAGQTLVFSPAMVLQATAAAPVVDGGANTGASTGIVRGQVTAKDTSLPLAGVTVSMSGAASLQQVTDANGRFEFATVPPGNVALTASATGYVKATGSASLAAGQILVFSPVLPKAEPAPTTGTFSALVVNAADNAPLAAAVVQLTEAGGVVTTATLDVDGRFSLTLPPGSYVARYSLSGYGGVEQRFLLSAGARVDGGLVALSAIRTQSNVSGKVLDANGLPISGATVVVVGSDNLSAQTVADGSYGITNAGTTTVTLRASAVGYDTQSVTLQSSQPTDMSYTFNLSIQGTAGASVYQLSVSPASVAGGADVVGQAVVVATGNTAVQFVPQFQIRDSAGQVVATGVATQAGIPLGTVALNPGAERSMSLAWNAAQFAPGSYSMVARLIEPGSQSTSNPAGVVLAERAAAFVIQPSSKLLGSVTANPPVLRAGTGTAVALTGNLQNGGNSELPADTYKLSVRNSKTNVEVFATSQSASAMAVNGLASLDLGGWTPADAGDYVLELTGSNPGAGKITGKLYVGEAGSATFKVDKPIVPTGTQRVRASIDIRGQDLANGTISDPLVPRVKAAITKAVNYADDFAYKHYLNDLKCYACHVQTQAIVGGERNLKFLKPLDPLKRSVLMNSITQYVIDEGAIPHQGNSFKVTNTTLGLWATEEWHGKADLGLSRYKMAKYLMGMQQPNGSWNPDHADVWWATKAPYVGLNVASLSALSRSLSAPDAKPITQPQLAAVPAMAALPTGDMRMSSAADGTVYVAHLSAQKIWKLPPGGTLTQIASAISVTGVRALADGRLLVSARSGVYLMDTAGTLRQISKQDAWDAVALDDGTYMVSPWGGRTIYKLTEEGIQTPYFDSDLFTTSSGTINKLPDGSFLVHGHAGYRFVRFNAQGLMNVPIALTDGRPIDAIPYKDGFLVGTEAGLFFYNSEWVGERWHTGRVVGLVELPDGRVLVNAGNKIMEVTQAAVDLSTVKAQIDNSLTKATTWLLSGSEVTASNNIDLAFRLYGLGQIKARNVGGTQSAQIDQAINDVATVLRSRQRSDGGWVWRQGVETVSDPLVTAMVGIALDVLNPSPESPEVRKAVEWLLSKQRADGTWVSASIAPSVPLLTSTWVEIWLPVMLDRLGGIDTVLTAVLPADVQASGFTLAPTTQTAQVDGTTKLTWRLDGVTSAGRALQFDLEMPNLAPNEVRAAAVRAYLTFNNTFTDQPVDLDLEVPKVTATTGLGASVSTDKLSYGPDSPVVISSSVVNSALLAQDGSVAMRVFAPDGKLIQELGAFPTKTLAPGASVNVSNIWNTGQWLAAEGYKVQADLLDAQGRLIGTSETKFAIAVPQDMGVAARISADKRQYVPNDSVVLLDRITNQASNSVLEDLKARTSVRHGSGDLLWESSQPLAQLVGGAVKELSYRLPLGNAKAGQYHATLTVLNASDEVVASSAIAFEVQSTAETGVGLSGTLAALGSPVPAGDAIALSWSVTNRGNTDVNPASIRVRIVDPAAGVELGQVGNISLLLAAGGDVARSVSWTTSDALAGKTLVAVLTAEVAGRATDLAQTNFVVGPPPVKLDLNQSVSAGTGGQAKVLVLYDCESDYGWDLLAWLRLSYSHSCYAERKQFLSSYLSSLNVPHFITYDRTAFRKELRSGAYSTVWMLGGLPDCSGHLTNEVREAVNRGTTLLVDGGLAAFENHELIRLAGARYGGHIWLSSKTMDVTGAAYTPARLTTTGKPLRLSLFGGSVQASYANNLCYKVDYDGEDSTRHPTGAAYPAMVQNTYGRGRAVALGFDLISTLRNGGTDAGNWKKLVNETVGYLTPADEVRELVPGEYMSLATQVTNQASPADIRVRLGLPSSALVVGMNPAGTLEPGNKVLWQLNLPAGATQGLRAMVRAPLTSGGYSVSQEVSVVRNGQTLPYANSSQSMTVMDTVNPAKQALARLKGLSVSLLEALTLLDAKVNLDYGISLFQQGRYHEAVEELGEAANSVRKLSADLKTERLAIDRLMQEAQYRWYLAQPK